MTTKISEGISIQIETFYQQDYSNPIQREFMHAYRITLTNNNSFSVKLLSRHWDIFDSTSDRREVEGEGVVGMQKVFAPGEEWQYVSGCTLRSEIGHMSGWYEFQPLQLDRNNFKAIIPRFDLVVPFKYN